MDSYCQSCAAPLKPEFKGKSDSYCKYCSDQSGKLKSRDAAKQGIAQWFQEWQKIDAKKAADRAEHYMKSMPAWADR